MGHTGMKYSLASRELIADMVETIMKAHSLDGLVCLTNCDKITPGMLMAIGRLNIPSIVVTAGPMMSGNYKGRRLSLVKDTFEAVGRFKKGDIRCITVLVEPPSAISIFMAFSNASFLIIVRGSSFLLTKFTILSPLA